MIKARSPLLGAKVANLSPALADELRLDDTMPRASPSPSVGDGSAAQIFGFQKGDIIVSRQQCRRSSTTQDLDARRRAAGSRLWRITIMRGGQQISVMSSADEPAPQARSRPSLFAAAGLERDAPRPLADKLRPADACPTWSARIICSAPTARSPACWRRARSAR